MAADILHELQALIQSMHPVVSVGTIEEERLDDLLRAVAASLRLPLFTWTVTRGLQRVDGTGVIHGTTDPRTMLRHLSTLTVRGIFHLKDLTVHLSDPASVRAFREAAQAFARSRSTIVLSGENVSLPGELSREAVPLHLPLPGREEMREAMQRTLHALRRQQTFNVTLGPDGLEPVLQALSGLTINQARQALSWAVMSDGVLSAEDVPRLIRRKGESLQDSGLLEFYPPEENASELGGFERLKAWLEQARTGFGPEARALGLTPPRGVMFVGVQGCGKSLAAKAIARMWQQPLLKLDAARLYDKYIGETEKNLRKAFDVAEAMAPSVLWIDEIEKGFATGGGDGDSGLSRRLLGTFLTWLQERRASVFVAATANDLSQVPPELLRKGRFDELFFVDLPDAAERAAIFRIHLAARQQKPESFDLGALAQVSDGFSGAEIEQAVIAGLYRSLHEKQPLTTAALVEQMAQTSPLSVVRGEEIGRIRNERARFVPVR